MDPGDQLDQTTSPPTRPGLTREDDVTADLMTGLSLPPALGRGSPRPADVEPWLALVEELMGRGVRTPSQLRRVIGVSYRTCRNWMERVTERWSSGLTDDRVNWRRESLYSEADQVARAAWMESTKAGTSAEKAGLYKVILLANQRKAALTGLDGLEIKIQRETISHTTVDIVARVETEHGLAPGALERIGREAALALSGGAAQISDGESAGGPLVLDVVPELETPVQVSAAGSIETPDHPPGGRAEQSAEDSDGG